MPPWGAQDKAIVGSGSKLTMFYVLLRDYGEDVGAMAMSRLAKLCSAFITNRGFSIGIGTLHLAGGRKKGNNK